MIQGTCSKSDLEAEQSVVIMDMHYFSVCLILLLLDASAGDHDLNSEYRFTTNLSGGNYVLHWNVDMQNEEITFAVNASTTGWVGFGLSPNGQMPGSDVVIAWVDSNGRVFFQDRYATGRFLPPVDDSQDWMLISGEEVDGRTILEFSRPFLSCDVNDLDIKADTARIVWSYHSRDPSNKEELMSLQHERMGSASLNLLGGLNEDRVEEDSSSFQILNDNVVIPKNDTTYWCTVHALPNETADQERYLYKYSPVIPESSASYVHHIVAYLCTNLDHSHVGASERCSGSMIEIGNCRRTGVLFAAWAVGGTDFVFPNGVAYPIGGKGQQFIVLELHYDNPQMVEGVIDNSGLELFYLDREPENRAGLLTLGQRARSSLVIPPRADNFVVNALCPSDCTQKFFPSEGINLFGNGFHTHLAGHGLIVKHLRETTECGGLEELQPIDENRRYDFNYQQINILPRVVEVLPGDILHLQCNYRTTSPSYQEVTLGGESTREEMCFAFIYYYPETDLTFSVGSQLVNDEFTEQHLSAEDGNLLQTSFSTNDRQTVSSILNQVNWNQQSVESFQSAVQSSPITTSCIAPLNLTASIRSEDMLPQVSCPYKPPDKDCPTDTPTDISGAESTRAIAYFFVTLFSTLFILF